eukprot:COSAG05_NODE_5163_length_1248_cov_1.036554_2_plen_160_part_00
MTPLSATCQLLHLIAPATCTHHASQPCKKAGLKKAGLNLGGECGYLSHFGTNCRLGAHVNVRFGPHTASTNPVHRGPFSSAAFQGTIAGMEDCSVQPICETGPNTRQWFPQHTLYPSSALRAAGATQRLLPSRGVACCRRCYEFHHARGSLAVHRACVV